MKNGVKDTKEQPHGAPAKDGSGIAPGDREHGEGNYKAAREYDQAAADFAKSGKVKDAARDARPRSHQEAQEMEQAEAAGKSRSKGEGVPPGTGHR